MPRNVWTTSLLACWLIGLGLISPIMAQDKPAYQLFSGKGKKLNFKKMMRAMEAADIIFFGEQHNDPIAHWLQLEVLVALKDARGAEQMILGAEMFETDQQAPLNQFLSGEIDAKTLADTTKLWPNYDTDYRPVVELCKENGIPFIATNIPRKYARLVSQQGAAALDTLPDAEQALVSPLPLEFDPTIPTYAAMADMLKGHGHGMNMDPANFIAAQASKDATMADRILRHWQTGKCFYHLNGAYHSDQKEGIVWHINNRNSDLNIFTISTVRQSDVKDLDEEHIGRADIIICVPETMTNTY